MLLMIVGIVSAVGLGIWAALRMIARTPALLTDVKPCRGDWAEARLRGCQGGLAATGIPVEPFNTFSNLAYLAAGWVVAIRFGTLAAAILGASLTLLCIGSAMYHGTKTMWGARLDHAGMYAVFGALAIYCVSPPHPALPYVMLTGAILFAVGFAIVLPGDINARMGLLLALMSIRGFLLGRTLLSALSLGIFALAFAAWLLDKRTTVLSRFGHALWHVLTAAAIGLMFAAVAL
jgi:predicted membrane channel-forming protein YqfA (hemolysin III family)